MSGSLIVKSSKKKILKRRFPNKTKMQYGVPESRLHTAFCTQGFRVIQAASFKELTVFWKDSKVFHSSVSTVVDPGIPIRGHGASERVSG